MMSFAQWFILRYSAKTLFANSASFCRKKKGGPKLDLIFSESCHGYIKNNGFAMRCVISVWRTRTADNPNLIHENNQRIFIEFQGDAAFVCLLRHPNRLRRVDLPRAGYAVMAFPIPFWHIPISQVGRHFCDFSKNLAACRPIALAFVTLAILSRWRINQILLLGSALKYCFWFWWFLVS